MIKVCDAVMGMGKTSAAINYINSHPEKKFIFITPYLDEAERIKNGCPESNFIEPSDKIEEFRFSKSRHTEYLIGLGCNIATTHQAFKYYSKSMLHTIREKEYVLIIDEDMDILEKFKYHKADIDLLTNAGYLEFDGMKYIRTDKEYGSRGIFTDLLKTLEVRDLMYCRHNDKERLFFWALTSDLISSFSDVYVLTYLFEGQSLYSFFSLHHLDYEYISVKRNNGVFEFDEESGYMPAYIPDIFDKVELFNNEKLNRCGKHPTSLSMNWYKQKDNYVKSKNNLNNYFRYYKKDVESCKKMWGAHSGEFNKIRSKGFSNGFVVMNARATNKYADKTCLAYMSNVFMNLDEKMFYESYDVDLNEDTYALSTLIQWIWRSAIRNGESIQLYLPSKRMRDLLTDWMDKVSRGEAV